MTPEDARGIFGLLVFAYFVMWVLAVAFCFNHFENKRRFRRLGFWMVLLPVATPVLMLVLNTIFNREPPPKLHDQLSGVGMAAKLVEGVIWMFGVPTPLAFITNLLLFFSKKEET